MVTPGYDFCTLYLPLPFFRLSGKNRNPGCKNSNGSFLKKFEKNEINSNKTMGYQNGTGFAVKGVQDENLEWS